jgi:hypothetical protein
MAEEIVGVKLEVDGTQANKSVADWAEELRKAEQSAEQITKTFGDTSKQAELARQRVSAVKNELAKAQEQAAKMGDGFAKADAPMKSFRQQLREATQDLIRIQGEFGDISPQAQEAAQRVAELRDRIKDANEVAALFDPERKFQSVLGVGQGIASGFAAATGAMALFGGESKAVQETLLKVQAAMALAQGLQGVIASIEDFKRLGGVISQIGVFQKVNAAATNLATVAMRLFGVATTGTGVAFNVLKGIIISTGIGALVVLIGTVVSKIIDWTNSTNSQEAAQRALNSALERQDEILRKSLTDLDYYKNAAVAKAKIAGASAAEIFKINQDYRYKELEELRKDQNEKSRLSYEAQQNDKLTEEDRQKARDANVKAYEAYFAKRREISLAHLDEEVRISEEARTKAQEQASKAEQERKAAAAKDLAERKADLKKIEELEKQFYDKSFAATHSQQEAELRELGLRFADLLTLYEKRGIDTTRLIEEYQQEEQAIVDRYERERLDKLADLQQQEVNAAIQEDQENQKRTEQRLADQAALVDSVVGNERLSFDVRKQLLADFHQSALDAAIQNGQSQVEVDRQFAEAKKALAKDEAETKIRAAQSVSNALNGFAELAGEQTAAGKAFAVTSATIQAILGAQQAFTSLSSIPIVGPALGAIAAAGAIAAGIANVKKILAVNVPGKGSGGSAPNISAVAPLSPQANASQPVKLDQQSLNNMGNATVKAYVVESDVSGSQNRIKRIQNAAEFK